MTTLLSVAQMSSQESIEENLQNVEQLIQQSVALGSKLVVFPENFICFASGLQLKTAAMFEMIQARLEKLAHQYQIWLIAGTLPCPFRPDGTVVPNGRVRTTSLCISPEKTEARYDKIHLFDVKVSDHVDGYQESKYFEPGDQLVTVKTPFGILGLMICYDLRFPELALKLRQQGADILTVPAAFTHTTGQKHWQLLLQSRAVDTQCYVLGAGQTGWHGNRQTWGHSAIVNSDGQILEVTQENNALITQNFDLEMQQHIRQAMPLLQHRRLN